VSGHIHVRQLVRTNSIFACLCNIASILGTNVAVSKVPLLCILHFFRGQPNFARCLAICLAGTLYAFLGGCCPLTDTNIATWKMCFASKSCILLYWQRYCTALQQRASAKLCTVVQGMELQNFCRGCHLGGHHVGHQPTF